MGRGVGGVGEVHVAAILLAQRGIYKSQPSDCNIFRQLTCTCIATLLGAICGRLAALLRRVATCHGMLGVANRTSCTCTGTALLNELGQSNTTSYNIHKCCMKNMVIFKLKQTAPHALIEQGLICCFKLALVFTHFISADLAILRL